MSDPVFKRITRLVGKAIGDFGLIRDRDRILVALSGGKDSWTLLYALRYFQRKAPVDYELAAVTIDPGTGSFNCGPLAARLARDEIPYEIIRGSILEVVNDNLSAGTNPCSFCARLRRGMLYSFAAREGWNKIALGHHLDDFVETLVLNLFFSGSIKGMSPYLLADDGKNTVIRPLVYVKEEMTRHYAGIMGLPILGCSCTYQGLTSYRRRWVKQLLTQIEKDVPGVKSNLLAAMKRIHPRHLLAGEPARDHEEESSPAKG
ncbi:MAG: tRNA 2-thiocytidine(32) synthetase TtcA [Desulfomonile tiedjei]|nr:tRNA 2-thiocytidine(32) synthetase TtcA [Desulfomonile tiedjei]